MVARKNKSHMVCVESKGMRPETLFTTPPPQFLKLNTFSISSMLAKLQGSANIYLKLNSISNI